MTAEQAKSIFALAGIEVLGLWRLENRYWPDVAAYAELRRANPWWLVRTPAGLIEIGWRKRVISIDWSDTKISAKVTADNVTMGNSYVHAWSIVKAVEYLTAFGSQISVKAEVRA